MVRGPSSVDEDRPFNCGLKASLAWTRRSD